MKRHQAIYCMTSSHNHQRHPTQEASAFVDAGVFYVKTLADMANKPNAAVSARADWMVIRSWLGAQGSALTPDELDRFRLGWKAYIAQGVAPSLKLKRTFETISRTLRVSDPDCHQHKPPIVVMDAFDRLLASDAEIREKRSTNAQATEELDSTLRAAIAEGRIAAEKEALSNAPKLDSDWWMHDNPASTDPSAQWRRDSSAEGRMWGLIAVVWFVLAWAGGALFDPFELDPQGTGRITNWSAVDCLVWLMVSLLPLAAWRLKVFCDRYV